MLSLDCWKTTRWSNETCQPACKHASLLLAYLNKLIRWCDSFGAGMQCRFFSWHRYLKPAPSSYCTARKKHFSPTPPHPKIVSSIYILYITIVMTNGIASIWVKSWLSVFITLQVYTFGSPATWSWSLVCCTVRMSVHFDCIISYWQSFFESRHLVVLVICNKATQKNCEIGVTYLKEDKCGLTIFLIYLYTYLCSNSCTGMWYGPTYVMTHIQQHADYILQRQEELCYPSVHRTSHSRKYGTNRRQQFDQTWVKASQCTCACEI